MRVYGRPEFWWRTAIVGGGAVGLLTGDHRVVFYTTQSNLVTLGYFGGLLYWMVRRGSTEPAAPRLRGAVTLWILITCLISHFVLNGGASPFPGLVHGDAATVLNNRSLFLVHYLVPVMVLVDWVAFGPHRVIPWRDLPLWLIFPLGYGVSSVFRAVLFPAVPDRYPYFFLDPTGHGYGWVVLWMLKLAVFFAALGALLLGLDRLVSLRPGRPVSPRSAGPEKPSPSPAHPTDRPTPTTPEAVDHVVLPVEDSRRVS